MKDAEREVVFTAFVTARRDHLRRIAFAICGDWHTAEDLLQTALIKAYVAWPRIRREGNEEAYVRRIIVRANIDRHRRATNREHVGVPEHGGSCGPEPVEERSALLDALQELPEMQRKAVLLRYWIGLSTAETAAELGIAEGTVKSHASRGRERLQSLLADVDR